MSGWRKSALSSTVYFESSARSSPSGRHDQRIDLDQHGVGLDEGPVGGRHDVARLAHLLRGNARVEAQSAGVERLEADQRIEVQASQALGRRRGDLLDLDAACGRQHEERALFAAVEGDREVVLALDVGALLDPDAADRVTADVHAEDRRGVLLGLRRVGGQLDPAGLAAPADEHLRLHDHRHGQLLGGGPGLGRGVGDDPLGHRDPVAREELLALVLVEVHRRGSVEGRAVSGVRKPPRRDVLSRCWPYISLTISPRFSNTSRQKSPLDAATERAHTSQLPASSDDPSRGSSGFNGRCRPGRHARAGTDQPSYAAGATGWFERKRSAGSYAAFTARRR